MDEARGKLEKLEKLVREMGSVAVAFSGGVDSNFLLKVCVDLLGDNAVGVTATSPTYPEYEFLEAKDLAASFGCRHIIMESNELEIPGFSENSLERCYFCKSELFSLLADEAKELGLAVLADGTNCDDLNDFRPGRKASEETGVRSPLVEAGMNKEDIRQLSREFGLRTWNKPAFACLSSRFPYGTDITLDRVKRVDSCENILRRFSFSQFRVRYHDDVARIEVGEVDFDRLLSEEVRKVVVSGFKEQGFKYVSLDMEGYRTGSMNEAVI